jgi:hypothetical protein
MAVLLLFDLLSYLVRFGRIAKVTIKGAKGPQFALRRRTASSDQETVEAFDSYY